MKKIAIFLISFLFSYFNAFSQQNFVINYISSDSVVNKTYFRILKPVSEYPVQVPGFYPFDKTVQKNEQDVSFTACTYSIADTAVCLIFDGFGHRSFTLPGDKINISFKMMNKTNGRFLLNGKYSSPFYFDFAYEGRNKFIYALFDSLTYKTGALSTSGDIGLRENNYNLNTFFDTVTAVYQHRIHYLRTYCTKYDIPATIKELAFCEIKANYINNLLKPLAGTVKVFDYNDYPRAYLDTLNSANFDNAKYFFKTDVFQNTAFTYLRLYQNRSSFKQNDSEEDFLRMYHTINSDYKNKLIQERLLSILLVANYKKSYKSFDAVRNDLAVEFPASKYLKYIDSLKTNFIASKLSSKDALATIVTDQKGNPFALNQIIKDKPLFIDCWASWCVPCLQQFPFSKELETKYKGKIDFAYLSFDKDKAKWIDKARRLFLDENSYLIDNNFSSSFANYFNISSIPRYIILDSKGNIVDKDAPRPTRKEALTKILDNLLAKDKPGKNWKILSEYKINKLDTVKWGDKLINHRN